MRGGEPLRKGYARTPQSSGSHAISVMTRLDTRIVQPSVVMYFLLLRMQHIHTSLLWAPRMSFLMPRSIIHIWECFIREFIRYVFQMLL